MYCITCFYYMYCITCFNDSTNWSGSKLWLCSLGFPELRLCSLGVPRTTPPSSWFSICFPSTRGDVCVCSIIDEFLLIMEIERFLSFMVSKCRICFLKLASLHFLLLWGRRIIMWIWWDLLCLKKWELVGN